MNGYVHEFLTKMACQAVEVTVLEADRYASAMSGYLDAVASELRLPSISWALEEELEAAQFVPQLEPQRKLS